MPISIDTVVNVIFGIVACLIAIGGIIATVHAGRNSRRNQLDSGDTLPFSARIQRRQAFRFARFTSLEYSDSDDNRESLPMVVRDISAQQRHQSSAMTS
ncbi:hypothetical protein F5Y03DRAFT_397974 [Xylaria venustula]|nr:hypothetical protein F5Y03DRAFT_397974 [Xylaria venustula]